MKTRLLLMLTPGLFAASLFAQLTPLNERIAVSSTAAPDYVRRDDGVAGLRPEGYIFTQGRHFESGTRDGSIEKLTFNKLVQQLAPDLARQKYFPARSADLADILIVVHWGVSQIYDDPQKDTRVDAINNALPELQAQVRENGMGDAAPLNDVYDSIQWAQENSQAVFWRNARLLGYVADLRRIGTDTGYVTDRERLLNAELNEERYFVVLMAYDYQAMKKDKRSKLLWTTRLSVRTAGNNFTEALPVLAQAGSHVFGKQVEGLVHAKANLREGRVTFGEMKILGVVDQTPPAPAN
jgi:hypothetical protein